MPSVWGAFDHSFLCRRRLLPGQQLLGGDRASAGQWHDHQLDGVGVVHLRHSGGDLHGHGRAFGHPATVTNSTYSANPTLTWNVTNPVTLTSPGDQSHGEGDTVALQIQADEADEATLSYTASCLPVGLSIDPATGLISGTITASGTYQTTVRASNGTSSSTQLVMWSVSGPVTMTTPGDQSHSEGDQVALQLQASDVSGGTLTYSADELPTGLSIDPNSGLIAGTITAGEAGQGPLTTTVMASAGTYSATLTFTWNVTSPVSIASPGNQYHTEGDQVALPIQATNIGSSTLTYSAANLPTGLSIGRESLDHHGQGQ
jgi:hypothetical protein